MVKRLTALLSGDNKYWLKSRFFCLFSCAVILCSAPPVLAQNIDKPLLTWLPLLTSELQLLQPDRHCPQNKISNIQLRKEGDYVNADIAAVDWDLQCKAELAEGDPGPTSTSLAASEDKIDAQIKTLFKRLSLLPATDIRIKKINLHSSISNHALNFNAVIKKTAQLIIINLSAKQFAVNIKINLINKTLNLDANIALQELEKLFPLAKKFKQYLPPQLKLTYKSDMEHWQKGTFTLNSQGQLAELAQHFEFSAAGSVALLTEQLTINNMRLNLKNVRHNISAQQNWQTAYLQLKLAEPTLINLSSQSVKSLPVQLRVGRSVLLTKSTGKSSQRIVVNKQKLPSFFAAVDIQGGINDMTAAWRLSLLNQNIKGKLKYRHEKLQLEMPDTRLSVQTLVVALRSYFPNLQLLEVDTGNINLQLSADYDLNKKAASLKGNLSGKDIAGSNDKLLFDGVALTGEIDYRFEQQQLIIKRDKQQLKIANLFVGIPIQALQLDTQINGLDVLIKQFKARLLGGRVDFDDLQLSAPGQTSIKLSGLSLSEIIKYSAYPEISSQGIIDGLLPLSLTEQGVAIKNGTISARHPGYIKVPENTVVKAMGEGNPAFSFAMQVLTNLQFESLQGMVDYAADGESSLKVKMKGINPNLSKTRPVIFNYSHNENILQLLKSLRFNERLNKQIEERY